VHNFHSLRGLSATRCCRQAADAMGDTNRDANLDKSADRPAVTPELRSLAAKATVLFPRVKKTQTVGSTRRLGGRRRAEQRPMPAIIPSGRWYKSSDDDRRHAVMYLCR
jgi:hypothetical protein